MPAKSSPNRKAATRRSAPPRRTRVETPDAHEFDENEEQDDEGYFSRKASQVAEYSREHQGRVVLTALVTGFSIGLFLGGLLAHSKKQESWSDRLAAEGLGKRLMERVDSLLPQAVAERLGRG